MAPQRKPAAREKKHRLPRECYQGEVTVAFTACIEDEKPLFEDSGVVQTFLEKLKTATEKNHCLVFVYCFMPEHQHLILHGQDSEADSWQAMVDYKQQTGFWLGSHREAVHWQKDFYDHVIRCDEDLGAQIRYVANNPVRRGLVRDWVDYPFTGAMGIDLKAVVDGVTTL